ncbi:MAG: hemerythrin domain-containing protein [Paludibacter sp.]
MKQTHDLIQDLSNEHLAIKSILKTITKIVDNTNLRKFYDVKDVEGIIDFVNTFVIKNHYRKEELLFQSLSSLVTKSEIDAFKVLTEDHVNETAIVKEIIMSLDKCKSISPSSFQVINNNLKTYVDMLHAHIRLEDNTIYPIINKFLTEKNQIELMAQYENIKTEVFKNITLEQYKQFTQKLEAKYDHKYEMVFF